MEHSASIYYCFKVTGWPNEMMAKYNAVSNKRPLCGMHWVYYTVSPYIYIYIY